MSKIWSYQSRNWGHFLAGKGKEAGTISWAAAILRHRVNLQTIQNPEDQILVWHCREELLNWAAYDIFNQKLCMMKVMKQNQVRLEHRQRSAHLTWVLPMSRQFDSWLDLGWVEKTNLITLRSVFLGKSSLASSDFCWLIFWGLISFQAWTSQTIFD